MTGRPAPAIVLSGPTGSGKSALALALAKALPSVIINADAMQLYAGLRILSARPGWPDCCVARHRLYGILDHRQRCSAMQWREMARREVAAARAEGRRPIIVGGPGLYLKSFFTSLAPIPTIDPKVRRAIRALDAAEGYRRLRRCDPMTAQRLHPHDGQRILRALEVFESTGRSLRDWQRRSPARRDSGQEAEGEERPFLIVVKAGREELAKRVRWRFQAMIDQGAVEEVDRLRRHRRIEESALIDAYGVREILDHLAGRSTLEAALEHSCRRIDRFIRRQIGWLRRHFPDPDFTVSGIVETRPDVTALIRALAGFSLAR